MLHKRYLTGERPMDVIDKRLMDFGVISTNGDYFELDLNEWDFMEDDMYGAIIHPNYETRNRYGLDGRRYYFNLLKDMSLVKSKEELKMKCDLENGCGVQS